MSTEDGSITVKEAAEWFGVAASTVKHWIKIHEIESVGIKGVAKRYPFPALVAADRQARNAPTQPGRKRATKTAGC